MDEFTEKERHLIDELYERKNKEDATFNVEELDLLSRYESAIAIRDHEYSERDKKRIEDEERIMQSLLQTEKVARDNLNELHARALSRMDRLEKRERETIEQAQAKDGFVYGV